MRTTCSICRHPERDKIDAELLAGKPTRELAQRFELSRSSLERHNRNHLKQVSQAIIAVSHDHSPASQERANPNGRPANGPDPWERQLRESIPAWRAFQAFLELSAAHPERDVSYEEAAREVGKNKSLVSRWARVIRNGLNWRDRRDAWLAHVDRARAARLMRETEQARERWRHTGRTMQDLGTQRIAAINPQKLPVHEARRFVIDGSQLESRGLGLDRSAVQVSQTANIAIDPRALENATRILIERRQRILLEQRKKEEEACTISPPTDLS